MPTNDNRTKYFLHDLGFAQTFNVSQSFWDAYPTVKTEATEEAEAVMYSEADGLTHYEGLKLAMPSRVSYIIHSEGTPPVNLGPMSDHETPPEGATHLLYAFPKVMTGAMERSMWKQWEEASAYAVSIGRSALNPNHFLLPAPKGGETCAKDTYLQTGELP